MKVEGKNLKDKSKLQYMIKGNIKILESEKKRKKKEKKI